MVATKTNAPHVAVIGGGQWGRALATAVTAADRDAVLCTRRAFDAPPARLRVMPEIADGVRGAHLIVLAVPSDAARTVARALGAHVDGRHMIVHAVRGLSGEGLRPLSQIVRDETPVRRVGALAGPVLAADLLAGKPAVMAVASRYREVLDALHDAFGCAQLRVSATDDLTGLEWASALTGVLLIGVGYAHAIGLPAPLVAGVFTRAMHESARIGVAAGAESSTFWTIAGIGDLLAAMLQADERPEVRFGRALAESKSAADRVLAEVRVEGVSLLPRVCAFARERGLHTPVFDALEGLVAGSIQRDEAFARLMERRAR